jgi:hypothetical protein
MILYFLITINYIANSYPMLLLKLKEPSMIKKIADSNNKIKTIWDIVRSESGRKNKEEDILKINFNGKLTNNPKIISNSFNTYFLTMTDTIRNTKYNQVRH